MDRQDLFFSAQLEADPNDIRGWAASVYDLAPVQQPHAAAAAGHKTTPAEFTASALSARDMCAEHECFFVELPGCRERVGEEGLYRAACRP